MCILESDRDLHAGIVASLIFVRMLIVLFF